MDPPGQNSDLRSAPAEPDACASLWSRLDDWAARQGVDEDLALLICACTAAHTAGPRLDFEGRTEFDPLPAPTLIAEAGHTGFHQAVRAATGPLLEIQRDRIARHGEPDESVFRKPPMSLREKISAVIHWDQSKHIPCLRNPARDLNPDTQPDGPVRFVLEGALPVKPVEYLKRCHLYSALSVAEIETLPSSHRWREARLCRILAAVRGYREGRISIRGFMRFSREDLEWLLANGSSLIVNLLPFEAPEAPRPLPVDSQGAEKPEFADLHQTALRRIVDLRFARAECDVDFRNVQADHRFRKLREGYRSEHRAVAHVDTMSLVLPDLFVWYVLQLAESAGLDIDEQELAGRAIATARRLRRRVAVFHDRRKAARHNRERLALATKLVARMRSLDRRCKRRDLARGFDNQRLDRLGPLIDRLVEIRVFSKNGKLLSMEEAGATRELRREDFMESLQEIPFSVTKRLADAEQATIQAAGPDAEIERPRAGIHDGAETSPAV